MHFALVLSRVCVCACVRLSSLYVTFTLTAGFSFSCFILTNLCFQEVLRSAQHLLLLRAKIHSPACARAHTHGAEAPFVGLAEWPIRHEVMFKVSQVTLTGSSGPAGLGRRASEGLRQIIPSLGLNTNNFRQKVFKSTGAAQLAQDGG